MAGGELVVIIEDDAAFAQTLKRSLERRGYLTLHAKGRDDLVVILKNHSPDYALVDLKLAGSSGFDCIKDLHAHNSAMVIVVLTGFASINAVVEAIKLGATDYLTKPSSIDDIVKALCNSKSENVNGVALDLQQTSIKNLEWEHIHQMLIETDFNISSASRLLGMHRRTLARKLKKQPIR